MARTQIAIGSRGDDVEYLQEFLNTKGYGLEVDGDFGPLTEAALKDFQGKYGLDVDGIAGQYTWEIIGDMTKDPNNYMASNNTGSANNTTSNATNNKNTISTPAPTTTPQTYTPWGDTTEGQEKNKVVEAALAYLNSLGNFNWKDQTKYDEYVKQWEDRPDFSFDFNENALYQQYKDQHKKQGKMAMMDTMGQASAMTGGYGNSYAQSVGQQSYNAELEKLNDVIPELYQMELDKYKMEGDELLNMISFLGNERDYELGLYKDDYAKRLEAYDRAYDDYYNSGSMYASEQNTINDLAQQNWANEFAIWDANNTNSWNQAQWDYTLERDKVEDDRWQKEYDAVYGDNGTTGGTTGSTGSTGGNNSTGNTAYAGNQGITEANIKKMQNALGITADGKWGSESTKAAGGLSAKEAWKAYQNGTLVKKTTEPTKSDYADWDALDWESYFAQIRNSEGKSAAEEELEYFTSKGLIPTNMITYAAIGARGKLGH